MESINKSTFVKEAVYNCPLALPSILDNSSFDKKITNGQLYRLLPHRTSFEIECQGLIPKTKLYTIPNVEIITNNPFKKNEDYNKSNNILLTLDGFYKWEGDYYDKDIQTEYRISLLSPMSLYSFYHFLTLMKEYCSFPKGTGVHIHVDISYLNILHTYVNKAYFVNSGTKQLSNLEKIFKYKGKFNKKECRVSDKCGWINVTTLGEDNYKTIEYRIGYGTCDYYTLVNWGIELNKITHRILWDFLKASKTKEKIKSLRI